MSLKQNSRYGRCRRFKRTWWGDLISGNALDGIGDLGCILPGQLTRGPAERGERLLWMTVLASAIDDIHRNNEKLLGFVETWIQESECTSTSAMPFVRLCHLLELDVRYCRAKIERLIVQAQVAIAEKKRIAAEELKKFKEKHEASNSRIQIS